MIYACMKGFSINVNTSTQYPSVPPMNLPISIADMFSGIDAAPEKIGRAKNMKAEAPVNNALYFRVLFSLHPMVQILRQISLAQFMLD